MNKKKLLILGVFFVGLLIGYGAVSMAYPAFPPGVYNRQQRYGFFLNRYDPGGDRVWRGNVAWGGNAIDTAVDTANEFITFVYGKMGGTAQDRVGASFIIQTMLGNEGHVGNHPPSAAELVEWEARVRYAESRGLINWNFNYSYVLNSYYQGCCAGPNWTDDGFYDDPAGLRTDPAIVFGDGTGGGFGNVIYAIKWHCANPIGRVDPIPDDLNFNMSGASSVDDVDRAVLPGQSINFTHSLTNAGPTETGTSIGWTTQSATSPAGPWSNVSTGNAGTFNSGQTKLNIGNQNVIVPAAAVPNSRICRRIVWNPDTHLGGSEASAPACVTVQYDFTLIPTINAAITGSAGPVGGNVAEPGDTITFNYAVRNTGLTISQPTTCTYRQQTHAGYNEAAPSTAFTPPGATCAPTAVFPGNNITTPVASETVPAATTNTTICRSLSVNPATFGGGPSVPPAQVCVLVAVKPYARTYGGDIAAGGGVATSPSTPNTCSRNIRSAVIGWNKRGGAAAYAGAGVQFAQYAMSTIFDSASGLGASSGPPNSLSFRSNNAVVANGNFGGAFLSAPCIPDHYATRPSIPSALPASLSTLAPGTYKFTATGNAVNLPTGVVNPGVRVSIYVSGNSLINGNITFGGSGTWSAGNIPMVRIVTSGNMFIDNDVTQLDGLYVAQRSTSSSDDGIIFTCTSSPVGGPYVQPTLGVGGTFASTCDTKLTVNGSFVARQVRLLRTIGTLRYSNAADNAGVPFVGEVFNYNPALWITQPSDDFGGADYDAINSLPPIL